MAELRLKSYIVFAAIIFVGFLAGNWLIDVFRVPRTDPVGSMIAFVVPTFIAYAIWEKFGHRA
jgi:hypothetical protein